MTPARAAAAALICLTGLAAGALPARAQTSNEILYILPVWGFPSSDVVVAQQVSRLRSVIGEGTFVRVGFTVYINISMTDWSVQTSDRAAVRQALSGTIADINAAVERARTHGVPICLSFLTAIRERRDPVQTASELEDRRNMQWFDDNGLAGGWWTHSRYARKVRQVQEAYVREIGAVVADLMRLHPETVVAASGDGEVELSHDRSPPFQPDLTPETSSFADYSPFAVLEFRDWIRAEGLYAAGQPFSGQAYPKAARYTGDLSPAQDSNGDGHTLNGDFGLNFSTWSLRFGDWTLADNFTNDPKAIPASVFTAAGWTMPDAGVDRFDPSRSRQPGHPWWDLWIQFRQAMIWRHNKDFARWMTTSPDATGATIPPSRWYSDQIAADFLFGHSPANPDFRLETSASPWWTADVSPHGSTGITSFNVNVGGGNFARTLVNVAPQIAGRGRRWGILEWNPSMPSSASIDIYREEMALIERFRPSLVAPFMWGAGEFGIEGTPFETALKELVDRLKGGLSSLRLNPAALRFTGIAGGGSLSAVTPSQEITVATSSGAAWTATADQPWVQITSGSGAGTGRFGVSVVNAPGLPSSGTLTATVTVSARGIAELPVTLIVSLKLQGNGTTSPPFGQVDTPVQNATGVVGAIGVTGWALDDVGVSSVKIFRNCLPFDNPLSCQVVNGQSVVFVGDAAFLAGARPDVEAGFPDDPAANRAGWGYLMLTSMLPHVTNGQGFGGQGPLTLFAFATDAEGNVKLLGRSQTDITPTGITLANDGIAKPFGAIDTPAQGAIISGTFANVGWALTPDSNTTADGTDILIPTNGSTMVVFIDGVPVATVATNQCRGNVGNPVPGGVFCNDDVASIFGNATPQAALTTRTGNATRFRNLDAGRAAIGAHVTDTTTLTNGLHTIAWSVTDSAGRVEGIGSRFFTVLNGSPGASLAMLTQAPARVLGQAAALASQPTGLTSVWGRSGFDLGAQWEAIEADTAGVRHVAIPELGRLELWLGDVTAGVLQANGTLRPLPPGSRLDPRTGTFTWMPGPGYIGSYDLVFLQTGAQLPVRVTMQPKTDGVGLMRSSIDLPAPNTTVGGGSRWRDGRWTRAPGKGAVSPRCTCGPSGVTGLPQRRSSSAQPRSAALGLTSRYNLGRSSIAPGGDSLLQPLPRGPTTSPPLSGASARAASTTRVR